MCLTLYVKKDGTHPLSPSIAEKNITCYKIFRYRESTEKMITPYQFIQVTEGNQKEEKIRRVGIYIYEGYHSFRTFLGAYLHSSNMCSNYWDEKIIVRKCIIPKGSEYYVGTFGNRKNYVSNNLIITNKVF